MTSRWRVCLGLILLLVCVPLSLGAASVPVFRIGIVVDGPWERNETILARFRAEILDLTQSEFDVRFPAEKQLQADWTVDGVRTAIDRLLADPEVSLIIAVGVLASQDVCLRGALPKPVIAPFILNQAIQGIPLEQGASGVQNLSYITFPADAGHEIRIFREVVPFKRLAFLHRGVVARAIPGLKERTLDAVEDLGIQIDFVPVETPVEAALESLPDGVDAVFVTPMLGLEKAEMDRLIAGLIERKLPSYSVLGSSEVEQGILVGIAPAFNIPRLSRRVALSVQRILLGEDPGSFQVLFTRGEQLSINYATARAIGVFPSWKTLTEATLVQEKREGDVPQLTLAESVRLAVDVNLDLAAQYRAVSAGAQEVNAARSVLLPQVEISGLGTAVDKGLGSPQQAERSLSGSLQARQILFSEGVLANLAVQKRLQEGREYAREQAWLDIAQEAATAYLNVLRAKTFERIQKENVKVSRSNLELANVRQFLGASGPGEVYRWESQIATDQKAVIAANTQRNLAEMALNRVIHRPLEEPFQTTEIGLDDPQFLQGTSRLFPYIENPWNGKIFRAFMAEEGLRQAPELRQLDAAIAAQERALASVRRSFWMPTLAAQGELTDIFKRGGAGADLPPFGGAKTWTAGVSLSLPLFQGGGRFAEVKKGRETLWRLRLERHAAAERVEQRIRSSMHLMGASFAGIQLSQNAAEAARNNLDLVTDAYSRGAVSILDLLDAQNAARVAEQGAANAVYDFLVDLTEVERAVGTCTVLLDPIEVATFFERLDAFFAREGIQVRKRQSYK